MNRTRRSTITRFLVAFATLGILGLGAVVYVLIQQRAVLPFADDYTIHVEFAEASGVGGGTGQPVNVVGVRVGQVTDVRLEDGRALVTMQLKRSQVPRVYPNASATLQPITPLKDMQIELDPGRGPEPALADGATIPLSATTAPVPLEELLSRLDFDTRTYLSGLIASLDQGTAGRGDDIRRTFAAMGPTAAQARQLSQALDQRRDSLARLVHNLSIVSDAAVSDGDLKTMIAAGNQTLAALAVQDEPLRATLRALPETLDATRSTLTRVRPFAAALGPSLAALTPAVRRLPDTLQSLERLADTGTPILADHIRPLVRAARPLVRSVGPAVSDLRRATPSLTAVAKTLNYLLNELAYNPPGDDEGFLFWAAWALHNINSGTSTGDAHGTILRAVIMATCNGAQEQPAAKPIFDIVGACPD
jgi:phospholipid/cholesterol/gamma-HCH transport system substrate-binding protein